MAYFRWNARPGSRGIAGQIQRNTHDDRDDGEQSLANLEAQHGKLPNTLSQRTGNGMHYLFNLPPDRDIRNSAKKLAPGLDIRGLGGYIVVAPSNHENGRTYAWEGAGLPDRSQIADAPDWLFTLIETANVKSAASTATTKPTSQVSSAILGQPFNWPDQIRDGEGREDFILRAAGHLRGQGLDQPSIERILLDYNQVHIVPPLEEEVVLDRARRYEEPSHEGDHDWPEPKPVEFGLPDVPAFDLDMLPDAFRPYVEDAAERMQAPADYIAIPLMVGAAGALGNVICIAPKKIDTGWLVPPTLWGAVVGRPGMMKSPAMEQALKPLSVIETDLQQAFVTKQKQHALDKVAYEVAKTQMTAAIKKGQSVNPASMPSPPEEPQPERLLVNDSTVAKLGEVLKWSPRGVLVVRDELTGLLESLGAEGHEGDRAFYLTAWNGLQSYRVDRIGRGSFIIPQLNVLLLGGIQPGKLQAYVRQAVHGGGGDDGLLQRIQLTVWPDHTKVWVNVDRKPNHQARDKVIQVFQALRGIDPAGIGAKLAPLGDGPAWLHFDTAAQKLFDQYRVKLETSLRQTDRHSALESHLAKYRSLVPALALVIHLADGGTGQVGYPALEKAIKWAAYLFQHAKRVYASVIDAAGFSAKALADKIKAVNLADGFTVRQLYRNGWSYLSTHDDAMMAIDWLIDAGWLRAQQTESGGRRTTCYFINPKVRAA